MKHSVFRRIRKNRYGSLGLGRSYEYSIPYDNDFDMRRSEYMKDDVPLDDSSTTFSIPRPQYVKSGASNGRGSAGEEGVGKVSTYFNLFQGSIWYLILLNDIPVSIFINH